MEKNPFSLYDFLGYFVPGALCLFLCNKALTLPIDIHKWTLNTFFNLGIDSSNLITIFILIVFSYSLGHLISYLSSITIERYANIQYSYPSNYLIKDINKIETIFRLNLFHKNDTFKDVVRVFLCRFILLCILAPFCLIDLFIGRFLGVRYFFIKKLDDVQIKWYEKKENSLLNKLHLNIDKNTDGYINCDIHRIIHHYVYESIGKQSVKFDNYVALYGFLRALTLILLLFYFIISFRFGLNYILFWLFLLFIVVASFTSKNTNEVSNPDTLQSLQYVTLKN